MAELTPDLDAGDVPGRHAREQHDQHQDREDGDEEPNSRKPRKSDFDDAGNIVLEPDKSLAVGQGKRRIRDEEPAFEGIHQHDHDRHQEEDGQDQDGNENDGLRSLRDSGLFHCHQVSTSLLRVKSQLHIGDQADQSGRRLPPWPGLRLHTRAAVEGVEDIQRQHGGLFARRALVRARFWSNSLKELDRVRNVQMVMPA